MIVTHSSTRDITNRWRLSETLLFAMHRRSVMYSILSMPQLSLFFPIHLPIPLLYICHHCPPGSFSPICLSNPYPPDYSFNPLPTQPLLHRNYIITEFTPLTPQLYGGIFGGYRENEGVGQRIGYDDCKGKVIVVSHDVHHVKELLVQ